MFPNWCYWVPVAIFVVFVSAIAIGGWELARLIAHHLQFLCR